MTEPHSTRRRKPLHPRVKGAGLGTLVSALVIAELARFHVTLSIEEIGIINALGAVAGGWLPRVNP